MAHCQNGFSEGRQHVVSMRYRDVERMRMIACRERLAVVLVSDGPSKELAVENAMR